MNQDLSPYYTDPLHDKLDAVENSVERWLDPTATGPLGNDANLMDPLGQMLGELEASIEWTTVPPLRPFGEPEPPPIQPGPPAPTIYGSFDREPPMPQEPWERPWGMLEPPLLATPYFAHEGLTNRPYHPHPGSSTGSLGQTSVPTRWCPDRDEVVEVTACETCDKWGEHDGDGVEQCYHDWKQKKQDQEEGEDES